MKKSITNLCKALLCVVCALGFSNYVNAQTFIQKIEAEDGTPFNFKTVESNWIKFPTTNETDKNVGLVSNEKYISNIHPLSYCEYEVTVATEGTYELRIHYMDAFTEVPPRKVGVGVNSQVVSVYDTPKKTFAWTGVAGADSTDLQNLIEYNGIETMNVLVYLNAGKNILKIGGWRKDTTPWGPNMDFFELYTTDQSIPKPADIPSVYHWSYISEATNVIAEHDNSTLAYLKDNNEYTIYKVPGVQKTSIIFEFGYLIRAGACLIYGGPTYKINAADITLEYSTDKVVWTGVSLKAPTFVSDGRMFEFAAGALAVPNPLTKYYYKLTLETTQPDIQIAEFQLFGFPYETATANYPASLIQATISGTSANKIATGVNGTYSSSAVASTATSEVPAHALDRMQTGKFTGQGKNMWLQYDFNEEVKVQSYGISVAGSAVDENNAKRNPKTWKLEGSDDFGSTWKTLAEVTNFIFPTATYMCMKFPVTANVGNYFSYKLSITDNNGAGLTHMSQWQLLGDKLPIPIPPTSIDQIKVQQPLDNVSVYPFEQSIVINNETGTNGKYSVYSITGALVKSGTLESSNKIPVSGGLYIVKLNIGNQTQAVKVSVK